MKEMTFEKRQTFRMEPYCYDGKSCDLLRPRWMTSYPKHGDEEDGEILKLEIPAKSMPPGSRITIEVPNCPNCGVPADMNEPKVFGRKWPKCDCGFSWTEWVMDNFC